MPNKKGAKPESWRKAEEIFQACQPAFRDLYRRWTADEELREDLEDYRSCLDLFIRPMGGEGLEVIALPLASGLQFRFKVLDGSFEMKYDGKRMELKEL